jgi:F0F1-type ATP synthase delta subunit
MTRLSRRQLATYGADQILAGEPIKKVSARLAAVLSANITSVSQLTDELRSELANFIKSTAKVDKVSLQENIDKSVLGGVRIETAVHSWDKTVAKKLRNIRETVK